MERTALRGRLKELIARHAANGIVADEIADDEVLTGGERIDLESLMMLNLLFSIEEEFELDLTDQQITREVFHDVGSLTAFVAVATVR